MSEQKSTKMKGGIILAICIVVIIILLGAVVYLLNARKAEDEPVKRNIVVNEKNVEEVIEQLGAYLFLKLLSLTDITKIG